MPFDDVGSPSADSLKYWLSCLVVAIWREDGRPYPATSISNILAGLYRYKEHVHTCPNFMDRKDPSLRELTDAIQVRY